MAHMLRVFTGEFHNPIPDLVLMQSDHGMVYALHGSPRHAACAAYRDAVWKAWDACSSYHGAHRLTSISVGGMMPIPVMAMVMMMVVVMPPRGVRIIIATVDTNSRIAATAGDQDTEAAQE
jgi:hypothetical protein